MYGWGTKIPGRPDLGKTLSTRPIPRRLPNTGGHHRAQKLPGRAHHPAKARKLLSSLTSMDSPVQCFLGRRPKHLTRLDRHVTEGPTTGLSQGRLSQPYLPTSLYKDRHDPSEFPGHQGKSMQSCVAKRSNISAHSTTLLEGGRQGKQQMR
uniref:Uncharacterized protein n=1 Tax=Knipowitschia caucasica TaxID=637954 RepID=A0AAV2L664_KNICA